MKKRILIILLAIVMAVAACSLMGCFFDEAEEADDDICVIYHYNGGYRDGDPERTDDYLYKSPRMNLYSYKPMKAERDTWYLEGWYFDAELTEKFSGDRLVELYDADAKIDLYAHWIDRVTVTQDNFTEFFKVTSRWNGGLNAGFNAAINYSFEPIMAYDPELSAESIEISVTPHIGAWSNGSNTIVLQNADDYYYYGQKLVDSSAAGTQFQIGSSTLSWTLLTESFELCLLHRDPIGVCLEVDGGECEKTEFEVEGGHKLLKTELPTPQKSGYKFMGWFVDAECETEYEERPITRERTIYAKFKKEVKVTFHANGGTDGEGLDLLSGDLINTYTPQRDDYKFAGWYTDSDFENKFVAGMRADEADVDLYAKWAKIHTVTFETNGGTEVEDMRVVDGDTPSLGRVNTFKTTETSTLAFMGWYTDPECLNKYEEQPPEGDITLYALWAREFTIYNPSIDELKKYVNFEITDEYVTITENRFKYNVRQYKLTASVKEQYARLGIFVRGQIELEFKLADGSYGGNGYFNNFTMSAASGKLEYESVYNMDSSSSAYDYGSTYTINTYLSCSVYLPESLEGNEII